MIPGDEKLLTEITITDKKAMKIFMDAFRHIVVEILYGENYKTTKFGKKPKVNGELSLRIKDDSSDDKTGIKFEFKTNMGSCLFVIYEEEEYFNEFTRGYLKEIVDNNEE